MKKNEKETCYRNHYVHDQGGGYSWCSECKYDFGNDGFKHFDICPGCGRKVLQGKVTYNEGGSDF